MANDINVCMFNGRVTKDTSLAYTMVVQHMRSSHLR